MSPPHENPRVTRMFDDWIGRRTHPRIDMNLPVRFGLIAVKGGKRRKARFSGETMDVSMKGLGIRMNCQALQMIPIAIEMMGDNKKYDLEIGIELGGEMVSVVGEVRWSLFEIPHLLKMGVLIKGMGHEEEGKWMRFILEQYRETPLKAGTTLRVMESIQMASSHLDKASDRISQQVRSHGVKAGK